MAHVSTGWRDYSYPHPEDFDCPTVEHTAHVHTQDASDEAVLTVLGADPHAPDGYARSQWVWITFPNGDTVLATYPQDHTYFDTETDRE